MDKETEDLARRQREALAEGRAAEEAGEPVIYIHGRPYADPANGPSACSAGARPTATPAARDADDERLRDIHTDTASMMMTLIESTAENMAFIRKNLLQLAEPDRDAVTAAYGRILADATRDHRHSVVSRTHDLDMDL